MLICGLDLSTNSPGAYILKLDDELNVISEDFKGITSVKKTVTPKTPLLPKFDNYIDRDLWVSEQIVSFTSGVDYVALEGPAYGAKGKLFEIGQSAGAVKYPLYRFGCALRVYDPLSIKMFATGEGNADKLDMYNHFIQKKGIHYFESLNLPVVNKDKGVSPTSDIIDAYWIAHLLLLELKLRRALVKLKDFPDPVIRIFNRVTKYYPTNILDTEFLEKK